MMVPDLFTPVVGWRMWGIEGGVLVPLHTAIGANVWQPRVAANANCYGGDGAPHKTLSECRVTRAVGFQNLCGLYAYKTFAKLMQFESGVLEHKMLAVGRVALWGRVVEHEDGWRAQYGYPIEVAMPSKSMTYSVAISYGIKVRITEQPFTPNMIADALGQDHVPDEPRNQDPLSQLRSLTPIGIGAFRPQTYTYVQGHMHTSGQAQQSAIDNVQNVIVAAIATMNADEQKKNGTTRTSRSVSKFDQAISRLLYGVNGRQ